MWKDEGNRLVRIVERKDFSDAVRFLAQVAEVADALDHHPDVEISWNKVTLRLWTHTTGTVTERDHELAARIDEIL